MNYLVKERENSVKYGFMILINKFTKLDDLLRIYKCIYSIILYIECSYIMEDVVLKIYMYCKILHEEPYFSTKSHDIS